MVWLLLLGVTLLCLHVYLRRASRRRRSMLAHLPTYTSLPFIGNMYKFLGARHKTYKYYVEISEISEEKNQPFVLWICNNSLAVLSDPEDIRTFAVACLEKSYIYKFARPIVGNGLITAPGEIWKHNVKKLGGAFKGSTVDAFLTIFNKQSWKLLKNLEAEVNGEPFNLLHKYLITTTLEAICESALGESAVSEHVAIGKYSDAVFRVQELLMDRAMNIFLHPEQVYRLTPGGRRMQRYAHIVDSVTETIIRKKIRHTETAKDTENVKTKVKSFLDILLEMKDKDPTLTEEQIKSEVNTILVAGQETTASALNFIFLMLGCKPEIQQKLYDEIESVYGNYNRPVSREDLDRLNYCEAVIFETLRLYPPVPGILRYADRDVQLKSCTIPKDTICGFNIWGVGHSRRVWGPDALQYRPERWLEAEAACNGVSALLSFSTGKRLCIGKRYAINLLKTVVVHCVREFEFASEADKMALHMDIMLRTSSGNLLQVRPRRQRTVK